GLPHAYELGPADDRHGDRGDPQSGPSFRGARRGRGTPGAPDGGYRQRHPQRAWGPYDPAAHVTRGGIGSVSGQRLDLAARSADAAVMRGPLPRDLTGSPARAFCRRSYWISGSYAPTLSEKRSSFLRLLKNKGFKEERMTKVGVCAIDKSTPLES